MTEDWLSENDLRIIGGKIVRSPAALQQNDVDF